MNEDLDGQAATLKAELARRQEQDRKADIERARHDGRLPAQKTSPFPSASNRKVPYSLAITSGKGGVGKTMVTVNLACHFARKGLKVLVIDADLGLANIDVVLGLTPEYTIQDVLDGDMSLDEVAITGPHGITILPAASGVAELSHLSEEQRLSLLNHIDHWNTEFDVVLVDTGAGITPNVRYFALSVEQILIVATPDPASITDAYAVIKVMFQNHRISHFDLVVNQVKSKREAIEVYKTIQRVADKFLNIGLTFTGYVPSDPLLVQAVRQQSPVLMTYPSSPSAHALAALGDGLLRVWQENDQRKEGHLTFFGRKAHPTEV
jgi:flagellar biosynthesis protein FlhG